MESPNNNIRALHARIYPSIEEFNKPNLQVGFSDEDASFFSGQFQAFPTFFGSGKAKSSFHYAATSNWLQSFLYEHSVNLEDLLKLSDVMVEHFLGSNGVFSCFVNSDSQFAFHSKDLIKLSTVMIKHSIGPNQDLVQLNSP
ncbi:uncharacterized protein LOC126624695 isoform X2 [Malus sylvestris]|uniref:uncharacterized protein LOC126624695 isoform X2 n=1 Tax=Malus sylvestris TaxID=3752 RepID=UPI0021AC8E62|nr:uncharacterized protein LOC126624695 isoform X2 [Malus sylvestris]